MLLGFSLPNPFDLGGEVLSRLMDLGADAAGDLAKDMVGKVIGGLAGAVIGALVDLAASILGFFWEASEPELSATWFSGDGAPYTQMVGLSAPLLVMFLFAGIIQGALKGDTAGMLRMMFARLPGAVIAMTITVALGDALIRVTDEMSRQILAGFREDIEQVGTVLMSLHIAGSLPGQLLLLLFGFVGLLAAMFLVVLLFVRAALIYLIAAFAPLVFAASVWEPMRGAVRKLAEVAFALIVSKLAIAIALAVSSAALVGSWPGDQLSGIPTPEYTAAQADQSVTQSVGILLSAVVMFVVAAFMPFVVFRLLPVAEGAMVAQGVGGGPLRAFHSATATANSVRHNPVRAAVRSLRQGGQSGEQKPGPSAGDAAQPSTRPMNAQGQQNSKRRAGQNGAGRSKQAMPKPNQATSANGKAAVGGGAVAGPPGAATAAAASAPSAGGGNKKRRSKSNPANRPPQAARGVPRTGPTGGSTRPPGGGDRS